MRIPGLCVSTLNRAIGLIPSILLFILYRSLMSFPSSCSIILFPNLYPVVPNLLHPVPPSSSPTLSPRSAFQFSFNDAPLEAVKIMSGFSELVAMAVTHPPCPSRDPL